MKVDVVVEVNLGKIKLGIWWKWKWGMDRIWNLEM